MLEPTPVPLIWLVQSHRPNRFLPFVRSPFQEEATMSDALNPYSAPSTESSLDLADGGEFVPASRGARLGNFIIDYIVQFGLSFGVGIVAVIGFGERGAQFLERTPALMVGLPILFAYYFLFEATTGRTIGKLVTGTRVVNEEGGKASFGQVAGRTICRLIPFEVFSFFGTPCRGWHDKIPKTYVVKAR